MLNSTVTYVIVRYHTREVHLFWIFFITQNCGLPDDVQTDIKQPKCAYYFFNGCFSETKVDLFSIN